MTLTLPAPVTVLLVALTLAACDQLPEQEGDAAVVVATVGDEAITHGDVVRAHESQISERGPLPLEFVYDELLGGLIDRRLMAVEARRQGADKEPDFRARLADAEENLLLETWLFKTIDAELGDERLQAAYRELIGDFSIEREVHARHILLASEEDANAAIVRLDKGEPFADLARELSTGPSASRGGDLGYFTKDRMIPAFSEAAFALGAGQYSPLPLQSEFGWHVILVEEARDTKPDSFEDSLQQLRQTEAVKIYQDLLDRLKAQATVERFERPGAQTSDSASEQAGDEDAVVMPAGVDVEAISEEAAPPAEPEPVPNPVPDAAEPAPDTITSEEAEMT